MQGLTLDITISLVIVTVLTYITKLWVTKMIIWTVLIHLQLGCSAFWNRNSGKFTTQ